MHAAVSGQCPDYICEVVTLLAGRNRVRAAAYRLYDVSRTRTIFGQRVFSVAGRQQWNDLPSHIRDITDRPAFKWALKSHFLRLVYVVDLTVARFSFYFTDILFCMLLL